jgi:hypothetical protein
MEEGVTGTFEVSFSWRYGVVGVYKDREKPIVRIYPLPFVRITLERT